MSTKTKSSIYREKVPKKFWNGSNQPSATTVGRLIKILQELPPTLRFDYRIDVVVFNIDGPHRRVGLEEDWNER